MVTELQPCASHSCLVDEAFDLRGVTAVGGASLLIDFMRRHLRLRGLFSQLPNQKSVSATYTLADELETHVLARGLGFERIAHMDLIEYDPLLCSKLGLKKLPQISTLYRSLERFDSADDVDALGGINGRLLPFVVDGHKHTILDLDTTVETVYGSQEGSCVGYNPKCHGRPSYQPPVAFEGNSKGAVHSLLRSGLSPSGEEIVEFYKSTKGQMPEGVMPSYLRGDRGFGSETFYSELEADQVGYAIKMKTTARLLRRTPGVVWRPLASDPTVEIQAGALVYDGWKWSKPRRIALIRTRQADTPQAALFPEFTWEYEAIVTNLDWDTEEIWHFYN